MNPKLCKICGGVLVVATLGQFIACGYLICRECGNPDLTSKSGDFSTFQTDMRGKITTALSSSGPIPTEQDLSSFTN